MIIARLAAASGDLSFCALEPNLAPRDLFDCR